MDKDHAARAAAMKRLDVFIGEWTLEASFPGAAIAGRAVFEWVLDRQFLLERSEVPGAPTASRLSASIPAARHTASIISTRGALPACMR